jgi:hypothetical protein
MLCAHTGIDQAALENSSAYIDGWLKRLGGDRKVLFFASLEGRKTADNILGQRRGVKS